MTESNLNRIMDKHGNSLLSIACQRCDYEMAEVLVNVGVRLDSQNRYGNTALHYAC